MGVTVERSLGITVLALVTGQVPDDESLVARRRQKHVRAVEAVVSRSILYLLTQSSRGEAYFSMEVAKLVTQPFCIAMLALVLPYLCCSSSNTIIMAGMVKTYMALEGTFKDQLFSHSVGGY